MKRIIILLIILASLTSCGTTSLYYWGYGAESYEELSHKRVDKESPKVICRVLAMYENILAHPGGSRQVPPPGICAEYAYMLLQPETMDIFYKNATNTQISVFERSPYGNEPYTKAVKLFEKEIELYPESSLFVTPLLKRLKTK